MIDLTDDLESVVEHIERNSVQRIGLRPRLTRWLGESTVRAGRKP